MHAEAIYPHCPTIKRVVRVGGMSKSELLLELEKAAIQMNDSAKKLFASELFYTNLTLSSLMTIELMVGNLGFPQGATTTQIYAKAKALDLGLCPLELGPHWRLQYLDQPEGFWGHPVRQHQAPSGSITVASELLTPDDDFPKGFYLRRIQGELWLRGYHAGSEHVWQADDHLLFCQL